MSNTKKKFKLIIKKYIAIEKKLPSCILMFLVSVFISLLRTAY